MFMYNFKLPIYLPPRLDFSSSLELDLEHSFSSASQPGFGFVGLPFSRSTSLLALAGVREPFAGGDASMTVPLLFAFDERLAAPVSRRPVSLLETRFNDSRIFQFRRFARNHSAQTAAIPSSQ